MSAFNPDEVNDQELDWVILRDGGIALYWRVEFLQEDLKWLESRGYQIHSFDAADWKTEEAMHESLQVALVFPEYYGRNWNALNECLQDDLVVTEAGGLGIVFTHFDSFAKLSRGPAGTDYEGGQIALHTLARAIRYHSLLGRRLVVLVQSDDPRIELSRLGAVHAVWNWREWLNKNRGL
jgi:RNAse (barnase) inhibitor barstar